jgi:vacuolar-type H+-ATPase subunit D/Vma8
LVSFISDLDKYGNLKTALSSLDEDIKNAKIYHNYLVAKNNELWQEQVGLQKDVNSIKIKLDSARKEASHSPAGKESSATNTVDSRVKSTTNATPTTKSVGESRKDNQAKQDSAPTN